MNNILVFTVENYRSIAGRKSISFFPSPIKDEPKDNVVCAGKAKYLRTAAIYGANSSGKSNLVHAIACMAKIVLDSVKINGSDTLLYNPFLLNKECSTMPSMYEVDVLLDGVRYKYGFANDETRILDEWLKRVEKNGSETVFFIRNKEGISIDEILFPEGKGLESRTNGNRLFVSLAGQLGGQLSNRVIEFFDRGINVLSGLDTESYTSFTKHYLNEKAPGSTNMAHFFQKVKLGFSELTTSVHEFSKDDLPKDMPQDLAEQIFKELSGKKRIKVGSVHGIYEKDGSLANYSSFDFDEMESAGTKKLFDMAGPIFDTLNNGSVLVIDELDAKMHPLISRELVSLFNDPIQNPKGAQLIFTTHDTNLLSSNLLRRDQIWFTEKDAQERTDVYNIMQIVLPNGSKPRSDGNMEKNYVQGRYGAIPYIAKMTD